ncbi:unnamed protein product [Ixodes hexagonus]
MSGDSSLIQDQEDRGHSDGSPPLPEGDVGPEKTVIVHPVPSGGFSTSSVSEEFVKELRHIQKCLEGSSEEAMQTEQQSQANAQAEENVPKGEKNESNRALRFQIHQPSQAASRCKCHRSNKCKSSHRHHSASSDCHQRRSASLAEHCNRRRRHHRHHHHRHHHQNNDADKTSSTSSDLKNRHHCTRQATAVSEPPCRDRAAARRVPSRRHSQKHRDEKPSHRRDKSQEHHVSRDKCHKNSEFFSRYKSSYSSDTSSSSSEGSPGEDVWETRKSSRRAAAAASAPDADTSNVQEVSQPEEHCQLESTVEQHVLELNFPRSTGLDSISNLLEHRHCTFNDKRDCCDDNFVHCMKTGQTCELRGDSQVIRVSLPEPHKVMVEHVLKKTSSAQELDSPDRTTPTAPSGRRSRASKHSHRTAREMASEPAEAPRFRRRHSYVRYRTRRHGEDAPKRKDFTLSAATTEHHTETSSEEDSSCEDDNEPNNDRTANGKKSFTEKGTEEIIVLPDVKTSRHLGHRDKAPRPCAKCPGRVAAENKEARKTKSGRRKSATSKQDVTDRASSIPRGLSVSSTVSLAPEEEAEDGSTFRIVFTDSSLNTELRCILQDGVGKDRNRSRMTLVRDSPCKRPQQQPRPTRKNNGQRDDCDNVTVSAARTGKNSCPRCDCDRSPLQPPKPGLRRPVARPCAEASDLVSSSYYSSTHESSLVLDDNQTDCKLCETLNAAATGKDCPLDCGSRRPKGKIRSTQRRRL